MRRPADRDDEQPSKVRRGEKSHWRNTADDMERRALKFLRDRSAEKLEDPLLVVLNNRNFVESVVPSLSDGDRAALSTLLSKCAAAEAEAAPSKERTAAVAGLLRASSVVAEARGGARTDCDFPTCRFADLEVLEYLATGAFGLVFHARWGAREVAVKMLNENTCERELKNFIEEVSVISKLDNDHCVRAYAACLTPPTVFMLTEYLPGGDLEKLLHHSDARYNALSIVRDVACGMAYLHSQRIVHRDLKPSNILLTADYRAKVADFGMAKVRLESQVKTKCGTPVYVAPEVISGLPYDERADIYSFGILMWETFNRREPFTERVYDSVLELITDILENQARPGPMNPLVPDSIQRLISSCLNHDPAARPPFRDILAALDAPD